jgi:hypothetical protein
MLAKLPEQWKSAWFVVNWQAKVLPARAPEPRILSALRRLQWRPKHGFGRCVKICIACDADCEKYASYHGSFRSKILRAAMWSKPCLVNAARIFVVDSNRKWPIDHLSFHR